MTLDSTTDLEIRSANSTDIAFDRSLRHADLCVIAAGQIVSLEYKYVGREGLKNPEGCAAQMRPCLDAHAAARLAIYSGTPSTTPVRGTDKVRGLLPADVPLILYGPRWMRSAARCEVEVAVRDGTWRG
jgi:hypothetical protein